MPYTNRQLLLQSPSLWRSAQLAAARVRVIEDATAADLVGTRTPADGDEEFERVWQIWNAATENFNTQTRFKYDIENLRNQDPAHNAGVFLSALNELVGFLCDETDAGKELTYLIARCIDFEIPRLCWVGISYQNFLVRDRSIPLAITSMIKTPESATLEAAARHEVPHCLFQAVLAFTRKPLLEEYTGFAVTLGGTRVRVSRAVLSPGYLLSLCAGTTIREEMVLYRSASFEIRGEQSRELIRLLVGLLRFVVSSPQAEISGRGVY